MVDHIQLANAEHDLTQALRAYVELLKSGNFPEDLIREAVHCLLEEEIEDKPIEKIG